MGESLKMKINIWKPSIKCNNYAFFLRLCTIQKKRNERRMGKRNKRLRNSLQRNVMLKEGKLERNRRRRRNGRRKGGLFHMII